MQINSLSFETSVSLVTLSIFSWVAQKSSWAFSFSPMDYKFLATKNFILFI